ncbi:hypothetical protein EBZ39_12640 [bacterium]|nr:hypothetical protein [bacterium]
MSETQSSGARGVDISRLSRLSETPQEGRVKPATTGNAPNLFCDEAFSDSVAQFWILIDTEASRDGYGHG